MKSSLAFCGRTNYYIHFDLYEIIHLGTKNPDKYFFHFLSNYTAHKVLVACTLKVQLVINIIPPSITRSIRSFVLNNVILYNVFCRSTLL